MRRRPRPYPRLQINNELLSYGECDVLSGVISFGQLCEDEAWAIKTLVHEETHWALEMFMDDGEVALEWANMPDSRTDYSQYAEWLPEKVALYVERLVWRRFKRNGFG